MNKRTNLQRAIGILLAIGVVVGLGFAIATANAAERDSISFARYNIRDWRAETPYSMLIETNSGDHYRATFVNRCNDLRFRETIGFEMTPGDTFDKFSAVHAGGQKCIVKSVEKIG